MWLLAFLTWFSKNIKIKHVSFFFNGLIKNKWLLFFIGLLIFICFAFYIKKNIEYLIKREVEVQTKCPELRNLQKTNPTQLNTRNSILNQLRLESLRHGDSCYVSWLNITEAAGEVIIGFEEVICNDGRLGKDTPYSALHLQPQLYLSENPFYLDLNSINYIRGKAELEPFTVKVDDCKKYGFFKIQLLFGSTIIHITWCRSILIKEDSGVVYAISVAGFKMKEEDADTWLIAIGNIIKKARAAKTN